MFTLFTMANGAIAEVVIRQRTLFGAKYLTMNPDCTTKNNLLDLRECLQSGLSRSQ